MNASALVAATAAVGAASFAAPAYARRERTRMDSATRTRAPGAFAELRAGTTHYELSGPPDGPPVVLIPGATLGMWIWDGLFERLIGAGYRVLRYDLLGRGFSDRPQRVYDYDLFEEQLSELLTAVGLDRPVHLLGLAFGGPIAGRFALRHSERVRGLTLMAPDGFGVTMSRGQRMMLTPLVGSYIFHLTGSRILEGRLIQYSNDARVVERVRAKYVPELDFKGFKRALLSSIKHAPIHDARSLYSRVTESGTPIQVVWGRDDKVTPLFDESDVRKVFGNAEISILEYVGHLPHYEQLEATSDIIIDFLSKTARNSGSESDEK
ncbi:alpha/beta fold hydrolase [Nocardia xishanensis]